MKKLVVASIMLIVIAATGYTQRASIAERLMAVALPKQMGTNQVERLEDGLHVALCGRGWPDALTPRLGPLAWWWWQETNYSLSMLAPMARAISRDWATHSAA